MFFRVSFVIGTIVSVMFVLFCLYFIFSDEAANAAGTFVSVLFLITNSFFLLSNCLYTQINKRNREQVLISGKQKNIGDILVVLTIISIVIVLFSGIAALLSHFFSAKIVTEKRSFYFLLIMTLLLLSGILATINLVYFKKALRENKKIVNQLIDDIQLA